MGEMGARPLDCLIFVGEFPFIREPGQDFPQEGRVKKGAKNDMP
jgi:hypothetical protein